jgi:hypothetical protein
MPDIALNVVDEHSHLCDHAHLRNSRPPVRRQSPMHLALAIIVLALHLAFILWVVFGVFLTCGRPVLRRLHIVALVWGLLIEIFPWTCPLTFAETWLAQRAGTTPYQGGFLLHYLDALVYPNMPPLLLVVAAAVVAAANIAVYWRRWLRSARADQSGVEKRPNALE